MPQPELFDDLPPPLAPHESDDFERWSIPVRLTDAEVIDISQGGQPATVFEQLRSEAQASLAYCRAMGLAWIGETGSER